jgi:hypothetical protein
MTSGASAAHEFGRSLLYAGPILCLMLVYYIALVVFYKHGAQNRQVQRFFNSTSPGAVLSVINSGGVYLIVLAVSAQFASSALDFGYAVASATVGLALGWIVGIVISPASKDEASEFSGLTKAISTFLTGYVLANLKSVSKADITSFLNTPGVPFRLMIGAACCFSTVAVVFISRRAEAARDWYVSFAPSDPKHPQALRADILARGPFGSREDTLDEIEKIKNQDEFKGLTLMPVRVDFFADAPVTVTAATAPGGQPPLTSDAPVAGNTDGSKSAAVTEVKNV